MKIIVAGSGPAGIAVAKGLLDRGLKVILLDVGNVLESNKQVLLNQIQATNNLKNTHTLRKHANAERFRKLPYGSEFIYKDISNHFVWNMNDCYFQPSFAQGGLSNVWGASIEMFSAVDLSEWPLACRDLSLYYSEIMSWLGPYYQPDTSAFLSRQAHYLKKMWMENQLHLEKKGFSFYQASLAVDFNRCRACGYCQYGCPYGLIYHTSIHLDLLKENANFTYINNIILENFTENDQKVELTVKPRNTKKSEKIFSDRLFVACGVGISSLLYLRSLHQAGKKLILKDSQHFMLPCLLNKKVKGVMQEPLHTLCQLKMTLTQKEISNYPIHLQFYTYMDLYLQEIRNKLKWAYSLFKPLVKPYAERLLAIQGYINSKESNQLLIQYKSSGQFEISSINLGPIQTIMNKITQHFKQCRPYLAIKPLNFLMIQSLTGQSNHISGSLEMSDKPQADQVDIWGRPTQFKFIHFVDASILPAIPAGSPTLTIMANAYRIGKEAPL